MTSGGITPAQQRSFTRQRPRFTGRIATAVLVGAVGAGVLVYDGLRSSQVAPALTATAPMSPSPTSRLVATPITTARVATQLAATHTSTGARGRASTPRLSAHPASARLTLRAVTTRATAKPAPKTVPAALPTTTTTVTLPTGASQCVVALAYLRAHANPVFSQSCDPEPNAVNAAQTNWVDGGVSGSIVIYDPACPASYENEASNSYFDFAALPASTSSILPGDHDAHGRVWDPNGPCN